ncbi:MAG TPA: carbohydrate ABC transporter permease [Bacteroidota bacterium]|jgi:multiple sugar transport system permease protein|nr:carbohydrate ABC transporter permease [Bacteroidota bacterium]
MRRHPGKILLLAVAVVVAVVTVTPGLWMLSASLMPGGEASAYPPKFLPSRVTFEHYITLVTRLQILRYVLNSLIVSSAVTLVSLFFNSMAGYAFAKYRFPGRNRIFRLLVAEMVIPAQVTTLPLFLMLNKVGLINTYMGVIVTGMATIYGIFLIRQFALSIPDSVIEAARIDGASDFRIYRSIIMPLCKPILITLAIFTFMATWNDFFWPLIVMTDDSMYTLPVALANLSGEHVQDTELMMAGSVITILPVMIIFLALQKYYISGLMAGSVKE